MTFLSIRHGIACGGQEYIVAKQNLVYRGAVDRGHPPPAEPSPPRIPADASRAAFTPKTRLLFHYSGVTNNAPRIHYDADSASGVEGYPALVVKGGITTTLVTVFAKLPLGVPIARVTTRAGRQLVADRTALVAAHTEASRRVRLPMLDECGRPAFECVAEAAP
jgi:3-methylfumaryl-CoA hydratase